MIAYDEYKVSSCDWIETIPKQWQIQRIKHLFKLRDERNYSPLSDVNLISLYSSVGVQQHKDIEHTTGNKAQNADGYKIVHPNDIVVNILLCWMGAIGRSEYYGVTFICQSSLCIRNIITISLELLCFRVSAIAPAKESCLCDGERIPPNFPISQFPSRRAKSRSRLSAFWTGKCRRSTS